MKEFISLSDNTNLERIVRACYDVTPENLTSTRELREKNFLHVNLTMENHYKYNG